MTLLLGIGICLFLSAFFSAAEMAFLSTDRVRLRDEAEKGNPRARKILELFEDTREFLTTVLIGNNLVNITAAVFLTTFLKNRFGIQNEWVVTAILAPLLIVFGETAPKGFGRHHAQGFLMDHSKLLLLLARLLFWPTRALLALSEIFTGWKKGDSPKSIFVNEDEFRLLIEESARSGILQEHEQKFVERILDFERVPIERVLIPILSIPQVELS